MAIDSITLSALSDGVARLAGQLRTSVVQVRVDRRGIGSGVIWRVETPDAEVAADATIITNAHVVGAGRSENFALKLADGREVTGKVIAVDPEHDLAALNVHASGLQAAPIGDSSALRLGEFVIAVGNPFGREGAVTTGVVAAHAPADPDIQLEPTIPGQQSAPSTPGATETPEASHAEAHPENGPRRGYGRGGRNQFSRIDLVQADVRLYPGNSGGPLADAHGRVIGVNAMIGGGLAFAIPSRTVQHFLEDVQSSDERLYLGVQALTVLLTEGQRQRFALNQDTVTMVMGVEAGSPAEAAGIIPGDLLLAVDGLRVQTVEQLVRTLNRSRTTGGQAAAPARTLSVLRGGERLDVALTPVARPEAEAA